MISIWQVITSEVGTENYHITDKETAKISLQIKMTYHKAKCITNSFFFGNSRHGYSEAKEV